jgi:hypothetical protein
LFPAAAEADPLGDVELDDDELGRGARANPQTEISVLAIISIPSLLRIIIRCELTRVTAFVRLRSRTMTAQLDSARSIATIVLAIVASTDTTLTIVGSEGCPVCAIGEILRQLSSPVSVGSVGSRAEVPNGIVDDLVFGSCVIEACRLADHFLGRRCGCTICTSAQAHETVVVRKRVDSLYSAVHARPHWLLTQLLHRTVL